MAMDVRKVQRALTVAGFYTGAVDGDMGKRSYTALFSAVARRDLGDVGLAIGEGCAASFGLADLTGNALRIAHFIAQTATETGGYSAMTEDLNYNAAAMMRVWPSRFPTVESTKGFVNNPEALANKVYGGRLGNGPEKSGDGYRYRGRGLIQLTGRANYAKREAETGINLVLRPEKAADPVRAVKIACLYWASRKINAAADLGSDETAIKKVRKLVNGGEIGLADAKIYFSRARTLLG
jgi:putative chitinase